jgi:hypothetical protein
MSDTAMGDPDTEEKKAMKVIPRKTVLSCYSSIAACRKGKKQI